MQMIPADDVCWHCGKVPDRWHWCSGMAKEFEAAHRVSMRGRSKRRTPKHQQEVTRLGVTFSDWDLR